MLFSEDATPTPWRSLSPYNQFIAIKIDIMADHKTPKSEMIRVPTALIPVVRQLSLIHRQGHTIALLQELEELIAKFDSNIDINNSGKLEKKLDNLASHLDSKLEAITKKLEQMERAIASGRYNNTRTRSPAYPYQQVSVELQAIPAQNLAPRLGLTESGLDAEREKLTTQEFISWTRNRDPRSIGWEYHPNDGLYHPVK